MSGRGKRNISYVHEEPAFITAFKKKTGYKEDPTVDAKRENLHYEDEDRSDTEDEKPTVVVLKSGDLTEEQVEEAKKCLQEKVEEEDIASGRVTFKKPEKRHTDQQMELQSSTTKKAKEGEKKSKEKSKSKKVKNTNLLSFDDDENDDDEDNNS